MKFNLLRPLRDPLAAPAGAGGPGPDLRSRARSRYPAVAVVGTPLAKTRMPTADSECTGRAGRAGPGRAGPGGSEEGVHLLGDLGVEDGGGAEGLHEPEPLCHTHTRARAHTHTHTHTLVLRAQRGRERGAAARAHARPDERFVVAIITVLNEQ